VKYNNILFHLPPYISYKKSILNGDIPMQNKLRVMIVEDEGIIAFDLRQTLEKMGYVVTALVSSGVDAIEKAENDPPDIILMDIKLKSELDGIDAARIISYKHHIPIIYLTSYNNKEIRQRATTAGASGFLLKPFDELKLKMTIENVSSELSQGISVN